MPITTRSQGRSKRPQKKTRAAAASDASGPSGRGPWTPSSTSAATSSPQPASRTRASAPPTRGTGHAADAVAGGRTRKSPRTRGASRTVDTRGKGSKGRGGGSPRAGSAARRAGPGARRASARVGPAEVDSTRRTSNLVPAGMSPALVRGVRREDDAHVLRIRRIGALGIALTSSPSRPGSSSTSTSGPTRPSVARSGLASQHPRHLQHFERDEAAARTALDGAGDGAGDPQAATGAANSEGGNAETAGETTKRSATHNNDSGGDGVRSGAVKDARWGHQQEKLTGGEADTAAGRVTPTTAGMTSEPAQTEVAAKQGQQLNHPQPAGTTVVTKTASAIAVGQRDQGVTVDAAVVKRSPGAAGSPADSAAALKQSGSSKARGSAVGGSATAKPVGRRVVPNARPVASLVADKRAPTGPGRRNAKRARVCSPPQEERHRLSRGKSGRTAPRVRDAHRRQDQHRDRVMVTVGNDVPADDVRWLESRVADGVELVTNAFGLGDSRYYVVGDRLYRQYQQALKRASAAPDPVAAHGRAERKGRRRGRSLILARTTESNPLLDKLCNKHPLLHTAHSLESVTVITHEDALVRFAGKGTRAASSSKVGEPSHPRKHASGEVPLLVIEDSSGIYADHTKPFPPATRGPHVPVFNLSVPRPLPADTPLDDVPKRLKRLQRRRQQIERSDDRESEQHRSGEREDRNNNDPERHTVKSAEGVRRPRGSPPSVDTAAPTVGEATGYFPSTAIARSKTAESKSARVGQDGLAQASRAVTARRRSRQPRRPRRKSAPAGGGYCEWCCARYTSFDEHRVQPKHQTFEMRSDVLLGQIRDQCLAYTSSLSWDAESDCDDCDDGSCELCTVLQAPSGRFASLRFATQAHVCGPDTSIDAPVESEPAAVLTSPPSVDTRDLVKHTEQAQAEKLSADTELVHQLLSDVQESSQESGGSTAGETRGLLRPADIVDGTIATLSQNVRPPAATPAAATATSVAGTHKGACGEIVRAAQGNVATGGIPGDETPKATLSVNSPTPTQTGEFAVRGNTVPSGSKSTARGAAVQRLIPTAGAALEAAAAKRKALPAQSASIVTRRTRSNSAGSTSAAQASQPTLAQRRSRRNSLGDGASRRAKRARTDATQTAKAVGSGSTRARGMQAASSQRRPLCADSVRSSKRAKTPSKKGERPKTPKALQRGLRQTARTRHVAPRRDVKAKSTFAFIAKAGAASRRPSNGGKRVKQRASANTKPQAKRRASKANDEKVARRRSSRLSSHPNGTNP